jgi:hypothetical protein
VTRRRIGQLVAGIVALCAFAWAGWSARLAAIPELRVYDGFWMILGASLMVMVVAPLVWRWPRERSLVAIILASALGSVIPLGLSALRYHIPLMARLRGAWILGGADMVGPPLIIGFGCLWFALREYRLDSPKPEVAGR